MRVRNCPSCYGSGKAGGPCGHAGRCGFCHGKKKVNSQYVKWQSEREKKLKHYQKLFEKEKKRQIALNIAYWEQDNPTPRKFPVK